MHKILVTGGCGYIGSHTVVDLIENGFEVISADNFYNSNEEVLNRIAKITGKAVKNYNIDLTDAAATHSLFEQEKNITGIIHFAAYKAVGESVEKPLDYYFNNLLSEINLLKCVQKFNVPYFVFSSSCTVYGNTTDIPVTEASPVLPAASPYGATKQMGEVIIQDFIRANTNHKAILLRYFNPVGAHPTTLIGELPIGKPMNLVPVITQTAAGILPGMHVHGSDYDTKDGSCVRDYIHVCDIAHAHTLAIQLLISQKNKTACEIFNLGTGNGITVLEAIKTFEKVSGTKLNYTMGPRRAGDVVAIYANNSKAVNELGWQIKYGLDEMMNSAWKWQQSL